MARKSFINIARAKTLPVATAAALGDKAAPISGENILRVEASADATHIYLSGSVGKSWWDDSGITEKEVRDALKATKKGSQIHVHINSEGGSVQEGLGIYNALKERSKDVTCHVDGYALSIASVIPLAAGKVISPKSAIWMIHNAWSWAQGNADDMDKQATMLREHDAMLSEIIAENTGKSVEDIRADMKAETWIRGSAAVEYGLADESDEADKTENSYAALPQAWLDRCKNLSPEILNALRPTPSVPEADGNGVTQNQPDGLITPTASSISAPSGAEPQQPTAAVSPAATKTTNTNTPMPEPIVSAAAQPTAPDALAQIRALKEQLITNRVSEYVKAQKITKAEVPLFVSAAIADEAGTFTILDAKTSINAAPEPVSGTKFEVGASAPAGAHARYDVLNGKSAKDRFSGLKKDWSSIISDALAQDTARNAPLIARGIQPMNANTYSATLVTAFLTDGSTTTLQNKLAALRCFSRDFSTDAYKPLAVAQHKYVSAGPTVQTDATNFESGNSTVDPITITPHQYTASINVSNSDLNSGLRMENLVTIATAKLSNKIIEAATAPITLANFTSKADAAGTGNVITAANFTFTDLSRIWGVLQKANQKFAILDGAYLAKLLLQPTYFQDLEMGEGMLKAFGWDGVALNSDWTGASDNIAAFFCDPQAIAVLAGLPLTPPSGIPGNTLQQGSFTVPGVEMSFQTNSWFTLSSRTAWMSLDCVFGASAMDKTAGVAVATA
jgi:ATP-dependent Clp protease protease subunit